MLFDCLDKVVSKVCSGNCQRCYTPCNSGMQRQVENYRIDKVGK